jgi:hypothetical protein
MADGILSQSAVIVPSQSTDISGITSQEAVIVVHLELPPAAGGAEVSAAAIVMVTKDLPPIPIAYNKFPAKGRWGFPLYYQR